MKKIILMASLFVLTVLSSCDKKSGTTADDKDNKELVIDTFKYAKVMLNVEKTDTNQFFFDKYSSMSLNELIAQYNNKDRYRSIIGKVILSKHVVPMEQYMLIKYAFWKGDTYSYFKTYSKNDIKKIALLKEDYICFNPSDNHEAKDIEYSPIYKDDWSELTTCYPIAMFQEIDSYIGDEDLVKIIKGYHFVPLKDGTYQGKTTVLLQVIFKDGANPICYDISHDPGN